MDKQGKSIDTGIKLIFEKKRNLLSDDIRDAKNDIEKGKYITGNYEQVMKEIDDEVKSDKQIQKRIRKVNQKKSLIKK